MEHAQHVSNFLVDEARLSGNMYAWTNSEAEKVVSNMDVQSVSLPGEGLDFYRTELYLF